MPNPIHRHESITLNGGVKPEDFERFMTDELMPHLAECYKGPTRSSVADLKQQHLLKDAKTRRKYLFVTVWDGRHDGVEGPFFEHARMSPTPLTQQTQALLEQLASSLGTRSAAKLFQALVSTEVKTNT